MSFDAEVLATYLAALSELASLKEVILGPPRPGGHFSQVESCGGPVEKVKWGKRSEKDCRVYPDRDNLSAGIGPQSIPDRDNRYIISKWTLI